MSLNSDALELSEQLSGLRVRNPLIEYIERKLKGETKLPKLLNEIGDEIKLEGRTNAITILEDKLQQYIARAKPRVRSDCAIPVLAGAPGLGKTKLLLSLSKQNEFKNYRNIVITYNNGHNPTQLDRDYPTAGLALRILYFGFEEVGNGFEGYVNNMIKIFGEKEIIKLTPRDILSCFSDKEGITILGVDEFNYLLLDEFADDQIKYRSLLKRIVIELGNLMINFPLFPIIAGTATCPLSVIITESSHPHFYVPMDLLSYENVISIAESLPWLPAAWKTNQHFHRSLAAMGGLPRICEFFLEKCKENVKTNLPMNNWPWIEMMNQVRSEAKKKYLLLCTKSYGRTLLVDAIIERDVARDEVVYGTENEKEEVTYGDLERTGNIILVFSKLDDKVRVRLPFLLLNELLIKQPPFLPNERGELRLLWTNSQALLKKLFRQREDDHLPWMDWESFEQFLVHFNSVRISFLFYRKELLEEKPLSDFNEIYPNYVANIRTKNYCANLKIKMGERTPLKTSSQFPPNRKLIEPFPSLKSNESGVEIDINKFTDYIFAPAPSSIADFFSYYKLEKSDEEEEEEDGEEGKDFRDLDLLVIGQSKRYIHLEIDLNTVNEEAKKFKEGNFHSHINSLLIIFSTLQCPINEMEMPNDTIFLGGDHLRQLLGHSLVEQAKVLIQSQETKININIASVDELQLTLHRVRKTRAQNIIYLRQQEGPFTSWDDLKSRLKKGRDKTFPTSNKDLIVFA